MIRFTDSTRKPEMAAKKTRKVSDFGPKMARLSPTDMRSMADRVGQIQADLRNHADALEDIVGSVVVPRGNYDKAVKLLEEWAMRHVAPAVAMEAWAAGRRAKEASKK
jgi:hypothetical protein